MSAIPVPFIDFQRMHDPFRAELHAAALRVIDSGKYIGGEEVKAFEKEMAAWLDVPEVCGVACATSGLFATLKSLGIGPGHEVITTVHTAIATAEAVSLTGASVVFCDLVGDAGFYFLDPADVARKVTPRTKAVIPVHLYGQPADLAPILDIARKHHLFVIEDCAQAQGARIQGRRVGTFGDASVFSFFPSKTLGGFGDGGAVAAKDPKLMKRIRMFSNHGRDSKYYHEFEGINSRLDALQAALLRVCLRRLDEWNENRRLAAQGYDKGLAGIPQIVLPQVLSGTEPTYHLYVITAPDREALAHHLKERKIETGVHYPYALSELPAYAHLQHGPGAFPVAETACRHVLSLPLHPAITRQEVDTVCAEVRGYFARQS